MPLNPHRGEMEITIAGRARVFRATLNALAQAEYETGERIQEWMKRGLSMRACKSLVINSCADPLSSEEVDKWIEAEGFIAVKQAVEHLFLLSLAGEKGRDQLFTEFESKDKKKESGTG